MFAFKLTLRYLRRFTVDNGCFYNEVPIVNRSNNTIWVLLNQLLETLKQFLGLTLTFLSRRLRFPWRC